MMVIPASSNAPIDETISVGAALAEPAAVAASWLHAPPWALVAVVALTLVLLALSHRDGPAPRRA